MVGFYDLSDTEEDSAIHDIISQAQDALVLEQVSAINCSSFADSVLPSELESRFRKLKSFPATKPKRSVAPPPPSHRVEDRNFSTTFDKGRDQSLDFSPSNDDPHGKVNSDQKLPSGYASSPSDSIDSSSVKEEKSHGKKGVKVKAKSKHGSLSPASGSSNTSEESSVSSMFKPTQKDEGKSSKKKHQSKSLSSPLGSWNSSKGSPSPPRKLGCFWCSPKKDSKKKSKENWGGVNGVGWDKNDEFLSDLESFSSKKQQKLMKKAMEEEQKISREAEKIVQWAKQASARMNVYDLSDDD